MDDIRVAVIASFANTAGLSVEESFELAREVSNPDIEAACGEAAAIALRRHWESEGNPLP